MGRTVDSKEFTASKELRREFTAAPDPHSLSTSLPNSLPTEDAGEGEGEDAAGAMPATLPRDPEYQQVSVMVRCEPVRACVCVGCKCEITPLQYWNSKP